MAQHHQLLQQQSGAAAANHQYHQKLMQQQEHLHHQQQQLAAGAAMKKKQGGGGIKTSLGRIFSKKDKLRKEYLIPRNAGGAGGIKGQGRELNSQRVIPQDYSSKLCIYFLVAFMDHHIYLMHHMMHLFLGCVHAAYLFLGCVHASSSSLTSIITRMQFVKDHILFTALFTAVLDGCHLSK